jgi:Protein of unknown function (DUF2510)
MSAPMRAGWYPDSSGSGDLRYFDGYRWTDHVSAPPTGPGSTNGARTSARAVPIWAWVVAVAAALPLFIGLIVTILRLPVPPSFSSAATSSSETSTQSSSTTAPTPGPPPTSELVPELVLPAGSILENYSSGAPRDYWDVPLAYPDTVDAVRRQLAIGRDYDGPSWCGEHVERDLTMWTWGATKTTC